MQIRPPAPRPGQPPLAPAACALVFLLTVLVQGWIPTLGFAADDYLLVGDPASLFASLRDARNSLGHAYSTLRPTLWCYWQILRELGGEPLHPALFLVPNLLLHGACAALLARVVSRAWPGPRPAFASIGAGLAFGCLGGGIQAVSFISAGADLLFVLFGLAAAEAFLAARIHAGRAGFVRRLIGCTCLMLALLAKIPALLVIAGIAIALVGAQRRADAPRASSTLWRDGALLAATAALWFAIRALYLGTTSLDEAGALGHDPNWARAALQRAAGALGQALVPWERAPAYAGQEPWAARLLLAPTGWSTPVGSLLLFGLPLAAIALLCAQARRALLVLGALTALYTVPAAVIFLDASGNYVSRAMYLPFAPLAAALGIGCAVVVERRRWVGIALCAWFAALIADGVRHVAVVERTADAQRRAWTASIVARRDASLAAAADAPFAAVLLMRTEFLGAGGPPRHSPGTVPAVFRAPFLAGPPIRVLAPTSEPELWASLPDRELARSRVALFGPDARDWSGNDPTLSGEVLRARMPWRPWTETRDAFSSATPPVFTPSATRAGEWNAAPLLAAHSGAALWLEFAGGEASSGRLEFVHASDRAAAEVHGFELTLPASAAQRGVQAWPEDSIATTFGAPYASVRWSGPAQLVHPPRTRVQPAAARCLAPVEGSTDLLSALAPPRVEVALAEPAPGLRLGRIELAIEWNYSTYWLDAPLSVVETTATSYAAPWPARWRLRDRTGQGPEFDWSALPSLLPRSRAEAAASRANVRWRVSLHHAPGLVAARTDWSSGSHAGSTAAR